MSHELTQTNNSDDSGFGRPDDLRGELIKWNDQSGWHSPDGLTIPPTMMVINIGKLLRRFHPEYEEIRTTPLPNPALLNKDIPADEWREGLDGRPEAPWKLNYEFNFLDPSTGALFTYANSTAGTRKCYDQLRKAVYAARLLHGPKLLPLVKLSAATMPTRHGPRQRPHLEILGYQAPPDANGGAAPPPPAAIARPAWAPPASATSAITTPRPAWAPEASTTPADETTSVP
jgi:hypothetical protein